MNTSLKPHPFMHTSFHFNTKTLLLCAGAVVAALAIIYFIVYESGKIHVTKQLNDGSVFSGYWKLGEPFGEGVLATRDGELIEGVWEHGKLNSGTIVARDFTYTGELKDYLPDGYGSCQYKSGLKYYGFWKEGLRHGLGKLETPTGKLKFGIWVKGELPAVPGARYTTGTHIYGIDVSNHQSTITWEHMELYADSTGVVQDNLKGSPFLQPVMFAVIKSTEGADWVADSYNDNYANAKRCGIVAGAYHFLRLSDINQQINNFIKNTHVEPGDLPPVLDMELPARDMRRNTAKVISYAHKWLEAMEKHYGVRPILYTYDSYYNNYLKGKGFEKYDFFIARYNPEEQPRVPHLEIWQFSEHGKAGGIKKFVDLDAFQGDYAQFLSYLSKNGIPASYSGK